jgi:hypothetical protein
MQLDVPIVAAGYSAESTGGGGGGVHNFIVCPSPLRVLTKFIF